MHFFNHLKTIIVVIICKYTKKILTVSNSFTFTPMVANAPIVIISRSQQTIGKINSIKIL